MSLVNYLYSGLRRTPASSIVNTVTAIAGVIGITIAVSTANQLAFLIKDYAGRPVWEATGSGAQTMSGNLIMKGGTITGTAYTGCVSKLNGGKITADANGLFSCADDISGGGGGGTNVNTGAIVAAGDSRFVNVAGDTMTGALAINVTGGNQSTLGLRVVNTASGNIVHAEKTLTTSGGLIWEGAASGASLYVGTSINGAGLTTCSNGSTSKVLWNSATGRFSCGTDTDTNTTYTGGQGIGLSGTAFSLNSTITGSLVSFQTVSGASIMARTRLTSSGALKVLGNMSGASLNINNTADFKGNVTIGRTVGGANPKTLYVNDYATSAGGAPTYLGNWNSSNQWGIGGSNGSSILIIGNVTSSAWGTTQNLQLYANSHSGSYIHAEKTLTSSGGLVWEGAASGSTLYAATSINGAGLVDCSNGTNSKLLWASATGRFSCGADQNTGVGGGSNWSNTGSLQGAFDARYVNTSGDTMTGSLNILNGKNLQVAGTITGSVIKAVNTLASSGTLIFEGAASGSSLYSATSIKGSGLTDCVAAGNGLQWASATGRFSCVTTFETTSLADDNIWVGSAGGLATATAIPNCGAGTFLQYATASNAFTCVASTTYTAGQGINLAGTSFKLNTTNTGSLSSYTTQSGATVFARLRLTSSGGLKVLGDISGATLHINNLASFSGSLSWEGTASGVTLAVTKAASFQWIPNCAFLTTGAAGALSCGTILSQTSGGTNRNDFPFGNIALSAAGAIPQTNGSGAEALTSSFSTNGQVLAEQAFSGSGHARYADILITSMPQDYNGGTMTGTFMFTSTTNPSGAKNTMQWGYQCIGYGSGSAIDVAWGTAQTVTATVGAGTANQMQTTTATAAITCAGTPAAGKPLLLRVFRDPTVANNLPGTGRYVGGLLRYKANSWSK